MSNTMLSHKFSLPAWVSFSVQSKQVLRSFTRWMFVPTVLVESGLYLLSNIHLRDLQLCMKGCRWHRGSAERNGLVKLRSIGRRDEWVTNKRREIGNRAILSSSLPQFHNGKIVTLEWACFATEDLLRLNGKWYSFGIQVGYIGECIFRLLHLFVFPSPISYHFVIFLSSFTVIVLCVLHVLFSCTSYFLAFPWFFCLFPYFWLTTF